MQISEPLVSLDPSRGNRLAGTFFFQLALSLHPWPVKAKIPLLFFLGLSWEHDLDGEPTQGGSMSYACLKPPETISSEQSWGFRGKP
jgi:hypothetical protein